MNLLKRFILRIILISACTIGFLLTVFMVSSINSFWEETNAMQDGEVATLVRFVERSYGLGDLVTLRAQLNTFAKSGNYVSAKIEDTSGEIIWDFQRESEFKADTSGMISKAFWSFFCHIGNRSQLGHPGTLVTIRNLGFENGIRFGRFEGLKDVSETFQRRLSNFAIVFFFFGLLLTIIGFSVYITFQRLSIRIENLQASFKREAERVGLSLEKDGPKNDELAQLEKWFIELANGWSERERLQTEITKSRTIAQVSTQVAHDIRSPLAALNAVLAHTSAIDESLRIHIKSAITRIRDIANNLLDQNRDQRQELLYSMPDQTFSIPNKSPLRPELISSIVESAVSEVRYQLTEKQHIVVAELIEDEAAFAFAQVNATELSRIIANLVRNSVEAIQETGSVTVRVSSSENWITLDITDDGKGIPADMLERVVQRGGTYGKASGNGLGLSHARTTVLNWGGSFNISSQVGKGTRVTLILTRAEPPAWFAKSITIWKSGSAVVLDDDPGIHGLWAQRLRSFRSLEQLELLHFQNSEELLNWYRKTLGMVNNVTYLCDFELVGSKLDGLSIIDTLGIAEQSILVTNRAEESEIQEKCHKSGVRMLPKSIASRIPIQIN
jgi:signal transduction histidine kinase